MFKFGWCVLSVVEVVIDELSASALTQDALSLMALPTNEPCVGRCGVGRR